MQRPASSAIDPDIADLAARYGQPLISYFLRRTANRAESEDMAQDVFLKLVGHDGLDKLNNPEAYIFTIAANVYRDRLRRDATRARMSHVSLSSMGFEPDAFQGEPGLTEDIAPDRVLLGKEALAQTLEALAQLPERTRDIFILHRLERLKHAEIAELYGFSVSAVEKHIIKASAHIASVLSR